MMRTLRKISATLSRRIRLVAARGILSLVSDAAKMQGVQVKLLDGETREGERLQNYGFSSVPHGGAECVFLSLNGSRDQGVVIVADDRRYRFAGLKGGEVVVYDDQGQYTHFKRDGVYTKGKKVFAEAETEAGLKGTKVTVEAAEELTLKSKVQTRIWDEGLPMDETNITRNKREKYG